MPTDPISHIVISRPQSEHPSLRRISVTIDGVNSVTLARRDQAAVAVTPGNHVVLASAGKLRSQALSLDVDSGSRIFLTVRCEPGGGRSMDTNWVVLNLMPSADGSLDGEKPTDPEASGRAKKPRGLRRLPGMSLILLALSVVLVWAIASGNTVISVLSGAVAICLIILTTFVVPGKRPRGRADEPRRTT